MKRQNRVSQLTLELYCRGLATYKERRQVEKALKTDIEVQNRYKTTVESELETRRLYFQELRRQNIQENACSPPFNRRKAAGVIIVIAAALLCAIIPAIHYLKNSGSNKNNIADNSQETEIEITEDFTEAPYTDNITANNSNTETKIEITEGNTEDFIKDNAESAPNSGVQIAVVPETDTRIHTRGGGLEELQPNINIPPGITSIFENMFEDSGLNYVVIPDRITSIGKNAFSGNPLLSITIGANVAVDETAFPGNFVKVYDSYGKAAGTYTRPGTDSESWEKK
jgi:hypothetical protein